MNTDLFQQKFRFLPGVCPRALAHHFLGQGNVVKHRFMRKKVKRLEYHPHFGPQLVDIRFGIQDVNAVDKNVAGVGLLETVEASEKRALAGSGGSADHHHLPGLDFGGNIHQGFDLVGDIKGFIDILYINHEMAILLSKC